jgi:hypothetical protein
VATIIGISGSLRRGSSGGDRASRPVPSPAGFVVKNGLNISSLTSGGMPVPLSRIMISTWHLQPLLMWVTGLGDGRGIELSWAINMLACPTFASVPLSCNRYFRDCLTDLQRLVSQLWDCCRVRVGSAMKTERPVNITRKMASAKAGQRQHNRPQ